MFIYVLFDQTRVNRLKLFNNLKQKIKIYLQFLHYINYCSLCIYLKIYAHKITKQNNFITRQSYTLYHYAVHVPRTTYQ
jgi:hypothetical protein